MSQQVPVTQSALNIKLSVTLFNGESYEFYPNMIYAFEYYESVMNKFIYASVTLIDITFNISEFITGLELVELEVIDSSPQKNKLSFTKNSKNGPLYIFNLHNKQVKDKKKMFTIDLCRIDAINNFLIRVSRRFENKKPEDIVVDLLKNKLESSKDIFYDNSLYPVTFVSPLSKPYELISWLRNKTVSSPSISNVSTTSAGFLFYENYRAYNYKSIDKLCQQTPIYKLYILDGTLDESEKIVLKNPQFISTLDLFSSLNRGFYSSKISFFDVVTQEYTEKIYSLSENYSRISKLGSVSTLPKTYTDIIGSKNPSRVMTVASNSELYTIENSDSIQRGLRYQDTVSQSISRLGILTNQLLVGDVFGNLSFTVGDVIEIETRGGDLSYDKTYSGRYLIYNVAQIFNNSGGGGRLVTQLTLARDSFGA